MSENAATTADTAVTEPGPADRQHPRWCEPTTDCVGGEDHFVIHTGHPTEWVGTYGYGTTKYGLMPQRYSDDIPLIQMVIESDNQPRAFALMDLDDLDHLIVNLQRVRKLYLAETWPDWSLECCDGPLADSVREEEIRAILAAHGQE